MTKLGVNIDHAATVRQARYRLADPTEVVVEPNILEIAQLAERGGADSITAHLREDRRHMIDADLFTLKENIHIKLNMEMACNQDVISVATQIRPDFVCLVPENRMEVTTEGGLDIASNKDKVANTVQTLSAVGTICSIFIDPDLKQIELAKEIGAPMVELHTGAYANAWKNPARRKEELERIWRAANRGAELGLLVNSGHGINYLNARELLEQFPFNELNIGHSIISRALSVGMESAVREMAEIVRK